MATAFLRRVEDGTRSGDWGGLRRTYRDETLLALTFIGLVAVVFVLSYVGGGTIARPIYMIGGLALAFVCRRRSPWLFLSANLWFWVLTGFVRRVVEFRGGFQSADIILLTPHLMALFILADIARTKGFFKKSGVGYGLGLVACVGYGTVVSFFQGDIVPGLKSATDWFMPLLYFFHMICNASDIDEADSHFRVFLTASLPIVVPYSLYQYFYMPEWDALWMVNSGMGSIGNPLPMGSKVFGPMNNPGFLAIWTGTCIIFLAHWRNAVLLVLAPFMFFLVTLTLVRAVYGSVVIAVLVGAFVIGRGRFPQLAGVIAVCAILATVTVSALYPDLADKIVSRFQSVQSISSDDSAQTRSAIIAKAPQMINDNPLGMGIGAQGRGQASGQQLSSVNIDFGPLSVYVGLGWVVGTIYILLMGTVTAMAVFSARAAGSDVAATVSAAALVPLGTFPFINVIGFSGVTMWICLGWSVAVTINDRTRLSRDLSSRSTALA